MALKAMGLLMSFRNEFTKYDITLNEETLEACLHIA